jgi:hypothetical protein
MDDTKCDKNCDACDILDKLGETLETCLKEKRPMLLLAEVSDVGATILLYGDHKELITLILNAIESDERLEELFMHVMAIKSKRMLKDIMGSDVMADIRKKMETHSMPKSQGDC